VFLIRGVRSGDTVGAALVAALSPPHKLPNRSVPRNWMPFRWGGLQQVGADYKLAMAGVQVLAQTDTGTPPLRQGNRIMSKLSF